jgi:dTDP-4-amino-4,6-dideoxygalactose transaminase
MDQRSPIMRLVPPSCRFRHQISTEEEIAAVTDTLRSGRLSTGSKTRQFEREFADYISAEAALALNSCTSGLLLSLAALGIGEGDEVTTTTRTFCSSVNVMDWCSVR